MESKNLGSRLMKIVMPLVLGGAILYWMYRDFDFQTIGHVILAQMLRGWRWKQTLDPIGEHPRRSTTENAVFLSYAASLVIPRIGEFTRCGVLKRWDGISFSKALGTVVTERAVDTAIVMLYSGLILLFQMSTFGSFTTS